MKRILPPIFMLMVVVVIAFATPIDAQKEQQVEPITTALHTEGTFETNLAAEPETVEVDDGLLTSPSGLAAEDLHLRHNLIGLEQVFIDAEVKHGVRADFLAAVAALESGWGRYQFRPNNIMASGKKSSQVWRSALTQSPHISPNIISVPMANIITAKLLKGSAFGITETPSGQK